MKTGWATITQGRDGLTRIIDALLDVPKDCTFTKTQLSTWAGVNRETVHEYEGLLVDLGVIEKESPHQITVNHDSDVIQVLRELDATVRDAKD